MQSRTHKPLIPLISHKSHKSQKYLRDFWDLWDLWDLCYKSKICHKEMFHIWCLHFIHFIHFLYRMYAYKSSNITWLTNLRFVTVGMFGDVLYRDDTFLTSFQDVWNVRDVMICQYVKGIVECKDQIFDFYLTLQTNLRFVKNVSIKPWHLFETLQLCNLDFAYWQIFNISL